MIEGSPILEVEGFSKTFAIHNLERHIPVFAELEFTVRSGEFLLVRGPNGVGKSTLLRCLFRSYRPTSGSAIYHSAHGSVDLARAADIDITLLRNEEIGFVTQFLRPRPRVAALTLVAEVLIAVGTDQDEAEKSATHLLDRFSLKSDLHDAYPTTFSGGEQQKVNLARALIRPRRLLLLDEPTASLDEETRNAMASRLGELKDQGVAMMGVLHHASDVEGLIDKELHIELPEGVSETDLEELGDTRHVVEQS